MITNPDHKIIKNLAANLLNTKNDTPAGLQKICNDLLPIAEFTNGLNRPNNKCPNAVLITLDGKRWKLIKGINKKWNCLD